jgi:hypothetical protein
MPAGGLARSVTMRHPVSPQSRERSRDASRPLSHSKSSTVTRLGRVLAIVAAIVGLGLTTFAQSGSSHTGDVFGDLIHIKRDPATGQPILQKRQVLLPGDVPGIAYCPIPVDDTGMEIPFLPDTCDPDPAYQESLIEVDYFGRLSGGRTQERNLRMHFDEAIVGIKASGTVTLDEAGRLKLGSECTSVGVCASWRTIDSPMENLSLYRWVMKYGHIQTDPLEEDTSAGGDPAEGTVYHPALDATDWAKFTGPVTSLLPAASSGDCFTGTVFSTACAAPQALTSVDFFLASALLAGAADKTGRITPDLVQYLNRILKIPVATPGSAAALNTLPALIRDENGDIAPATDGMDPPADERFVDLSPVSYLRADWFNTSITVLQPSGGVWVPTSVNLMTWLNLINGPMTTTAVNMPGFVRQSNDALRVVEFMHEYEIPADLWAGPAATITSVAPRATTYSATDQSIGLAAVVTSQSATAVSGTVDFHVRTADSVPVGLPVSAPVAGGNAYATYVLPGGTPAQTLVVAALFTPDTTSFASSLGMGTLTIVPPPAVDVIANGTFDDGMDGWMQYASPSPSNIVTNITNGVLQFYWVPGAPGEASQATIFQETGLEVDAYTPLTAEFDLGNSSTVRKRISVLLTESDFSDRMMCTFWLPANAPLRRYTMRTHTSRPWTNTSIYFYAATPGSDGGYYLLDNTSVYEDPAGPTDATYCVDPMAPAAPGGDDGAEMLANGDFSAGLPPWMTYGTITTQLSGGVLEFVRPVGTPAGVILQSTPQPLAGAAILTAQFDLGNSSAVRKRVTVMLHDGDFSDLAACMFWIEPGQPLSTYMMRGFATESWSGATISIYPGTVDEEQWTRLDNVSFRVTPATTIVGTECIEPAAPDPGLAAPQPAARTSAAPAAALPLMDARAQEWDATGFSRRADAAFGGMGVGWAAVGAEPGVQLLSWNRPIDLRNAAAAWLRFQSRIISDTSTAAVQLSEDGVTWRTELVVPPTDGWTRFDVDLSDYLGRLVLLRFVFDTGAPPAANASPDEWWLDDVEVVVGGRPVGVKPAGRPQ